MSQVWPDSFVDDSNLKVNIAALRKVLDEGDSQSSCIATSNGRGYRFVVPVQACGQTKAAEGSGCNDNLAGPTKQVIGRCEVIRQLVARMPQGGLITVVGSAGVGKTTVATAVAETLSRNYKHGVCFIDLALVNEPAMVPGAISAALGLPAKGDATYAQLLAHLKGQEILLVLDTCEHVVCGAAMCTELIQSRCPKVHILATSREALRTKGERVYRLPPLEVPPSSTGLETDKARTFPAVKLFLALATETLEDLELTGSAIEAVANICRKMDGVPLAIEFAAARVKSLGVNGLSRINSDQFSILNQGRRTGPQRHQSFSAALDWSFDLLPENERLAFLRLSRLKDRFSLESGIAVASGGTMSNFEAVECIANLVSKSLIERLQEDAPAFRLLKLTREYACRKLAQNDGGQLVHSAPERLDISNDDLPSLTTSRNHPHLIL